MKAITILLVLALIGAAVGASFIYSGLYDIGADAPHWPAVSRAIETLRDRSVAARLADNAAAPDLHDSSLIAKGAEHYAAMCTGCHLAPGMEESELRAGLYPQPPKLAEQSGEDPAEQFWIIKHGLKLTAMPAWGQTHDDAAIWALVAFVQQLPGMTPQAYAAATGAHAEGESHHHHHGNEPGEQGTPKVEQMNHPQGR